MAQKSKDGIEREFYENLNKAELEYGACKEFVSKDNPFADDGLLNKLARNVAELAGRPMDIEFIMQVISMTSKAFSEMRLNQMMADLKESGFLYSRSITEGIPGDELTEAASSFGPAPSEADPPKESGKVPNRH